MELQSRVIVMTHVYDTEHMDYTDCLLSLVCNVPIYLHSIRPKNSPFLWRDLGPPWFLERNQVHTTNGILIGLVVLAKLIVTNRETYR